MKVLNYGLRIADAIADYAGRAVAWLSVPMMIIIGYEVAARYIFIRPTMWTDETARFMFGAFFVLGGAYTYYKVGHVKMEGLYQRFPDRVKAVLDLVTASVFFMAIGIVTYQGWGIFWRALETMERTGTTWNPVTFPLKLMLPIGGFLIMLQGMAKFVRDLQIVIRGKPEGSTDDGGPLI